MMLRCDKIALRHSFNLANIAPSWCI